MARADRQFNLRLPEELRRKIEAAAAKGKRSITAEVTDRLEQSFSEKTAMSELTEKLEALQEAFEALARELNKGKAKK